MSKSHKARHGTKTKAWKDTVFASRSQAQARSKRKRRTAQRDRARDKAAHQPLVTTAMLDADD